MRVVRLPVALLVLQTGFAVAQSQPAAPAATQTLKVTTRLVQINVLVHDHHGNPIADLKKEDFEVMDAGKRQNINFLTVEMLQSTGKGGDGRPVEVLPSNMAINRPSKQGGGPTSVTVLLLDLYNTRLTDQMYARKQVIKFLHQLRPDDRIAIYLLRGNGFSVVHDFTNNSQNLLASIAKVLPGFSHELDGSTPDLANTGNDDTDSFIDTSNTLVANFYLRNRAINTCISFKTLAEHLAGLPGRKNVVWVSGGFPINFGYGDPQANSGSSANNPAPAATNQDQEMFAGYIESASQAMSTANVAVYPVDARGLLGLPMADASKSIKVNTQTHQIPQSMITVDQRNMDTMNYVAELTGGKAFYNTNDLENAIRKAIDDSSVTYTIGYYVPDDNWDNKYHKIKVKVLRSGTSVRTKKGYFAEEARPVTPALLQQTLRETIWSPLDSTALEISARIDPSPTVANGSRLYFAIDPAQLNFSPDGESLRDSVEVLYVQQTKQGKSLVNSKQIINLKATTQQLEALKAKGLTTGKDLEMNPQTQAVRIVILDHGSGLAGSVTLPVGPETKSGVVVTPSAAAAAPPQ